MPSHNEAILIGHAGKDPELRYTQGGDAVANFSIATSEKWKDKNNGEWQEKTTWHNIVCYRQLAERIEKSVSKGNLVFVNGKIRENKWQTAEGEDRRRTEIVAITVKNLTPKPKQETAAPPASVGAPTVPQDDIPF